MLLLRGGAGSGKTAEVLKEFRAAVEAGRTDVRLIVPTATLVRHLQHELARDGVVFSPRCILSLSRFARECAPTRFAPRPMGAPVPSSAMCCAKGRHTAIQSK